MCFASGQVNGGNEINSALFNRLCVPNLLVSQEIEKYHDKIMLLFFHLTGTSSQQKVTAKYKVNFDLTSNSGGEL